jgi:hypothetical protein
MHVVSLSLTRTHARAHKHTKFMQQNATNKFEHWETSYKVHMSEAELLMELRVKLIHCFCWLQHASTQGQQGVMQTSRTSWANINTVFTWMEDGSESKMTPQQRNISAYEMWFDTRILIWYNYCEQTCERYQIYENILHINLAYSFSRFLSSFTRPSLVGNDSFWNVVLAVLQESLRSRNLKSGCCCNTLKTANSCGWIWLLWILELIL